MANGNGSNTGFTYDGSGNLATVLDPVGNLTQWVYNAEGQVTEEINPLGNSRLFEYDADGNLARFTDRNGRVRVYEYDHQQRVTAEIWYADAADADAQVNPVHTIHFTYDDAGRIVSEWDAFSSVSYVYTDSGLLAGATQASAGGPTVVLAYAYNDAGLRIQTAATIDGVADYVDEYAYDSDGNLVSIAQYGVAGGNAVANKQITLGYNDQGQLATVARYTEGNLAVEAQYTYDSAGRLTALVYTHGQTILASYAWTYAGDANSPLPLADDTNSPLPLADDINSPLPLAGEGSGVRAESPFSWLPSGGLMPMHDTAGVVAALWEGTGMPASLITEMTTPDGTVAYQYDAAGQLLGATYTSGQPDEAYSYDANGNRVTANGAAYITGPNNQLLFDGTYWYAYDPEGNRTARFIDTNGNGLLDAGDTDVTKYTWDHRNRLTRVTDYDVYGDPAVRAVDYLYDVENRWIGRDVDFGADGQIDSRTRFAYDGNQIVLQFGGLSHSSGTGAGTVPFSDQLTVADLSHRYLWNAAAVDQLMADEHVTDPAAAGDVFWPLAGHLGTIRDLAAYDPATGAITVVNHRAFDAYGNLLSQSTTNPAHDTLFAFTGRPLDPSTGLQNNLHRWYDPATGRWMSEDPIGFEGRDANLSAYVGNSPVNATDPSGLMAPPFGVTDTPTRLRISPVPSESSFRQLHVVVPTGRFTLSVSIGFQPDARTYLTPQSRTELNIAVDFEPTHEDYKDKLLKFAIVVKEEPPSATGRDYRKEGLVTNKGWYVASVEYEVSPGQTIPARAPSIFPGDYFPPYNKPDENWEGRGISSLQYAGHTDQGGAHTWFKRHPRFFRPAMRVSDLGTCSYIIAVKCEATDEWLGFIQFAWKWVWTGERYLKADLMVYHAVAPADALPPNVYTHGRFWGATEMPEDFRDALQRYNKRFGTKF